MGLLSDRDLNKEYGFARDKPDRDYLGGREKRDFREYAGSRNKDTDRGDYLGSGEKKAELEGMANQVAELAERLARSKAAETAANMALKAAIVTAAKAFVGLAGWGLPAVKGLVDVLLKPVPGPKHGEDMVPPDYWKPKPRGEADDEPPPLRIP